MSMNSAPATRTKSRDGCGLSESPLAFSPSSLPLMPSLPRHGWDRRARACSSASREIEIGVQRVRASW